MIARAALTMALFCAGAPALAACDSPFMGCTLNKGTKTVSVCTDADTATYTFGPSGGTPELTLQTAIRDLDYSPWPGIGRMVFESVTFYNGDYSYNVLAGMDRFSEDDSRFSEVIVSQSGTQIAALTCDPGSVRWTFSRELVDAKAGLGLCWSFDTDMGWTACQ